MKLQVNKTPRKVIYRQKRAAFVVQLGGCCAQCGSTENLEFDHPYGRDWIARKHDQLTRLRLYRRDFSQGNLRLLCSDCNKKFLPLFGDLIEEAI